MVKSLNNKQIKALEKIIIIATIKGMAYGLSIIYDVPINKVMRLIKNGYNKQNKKRII